MLKIYNTLTRKKEVFHPHRGKTVRMFVCGPTVYDFSHIGHGRTYVFFDVFARYLRFQGFTLTYLLNITDIDDRIITRAAILNISAKSLARKFERLFLRDMGRLQIRSIDRFARATDFIPEIVAQIQLLMKRKAAYRIPNDGIYFDLSAFPRYGQLAHRTAASAENATSRIDENSEKRNRGDFCLWKFSKPGEPKWQSALGPGRPGWHIEDTAITHAVFGPQYEIHGGALDLIFPHHEAEIAQMETAYRKPPMSRYWMHAGFLNVRGEKMSKSKKNFVTLQSLLDSWPAEVFRLFVLSSHYRSGVDYDIDLMAQAASSWERIIEFLDQLKNVRRSREPFPAEKTRASAALAKARRGFFAALEDDLDTPKALAVIFAFIRTLNPLVAASSLTTEEVKKTKLFFQEINRIFGILPKTIGAPAAPKDVLTLAEKREVLRKKKRFQEADAIRTELVRRGWNIEDTARGPRVKPAEGNTRVIPTKSTKHRLVRRRLTR